jgi:CIC family chloride channel protein
VGYETTSAALTGQLLLHEAIIFTIVKAAAAAITIAGRMGGGVFSPSLMLGAMAGLAFGIIATSILPDVSGSQTLYALAGMGAVAAAVLGAPISTTLIVFELTGDWQTGLAVMVAVSMSTALASRLVDRSFFLTQLERRNIHLAAGPQAYLLAMFRVGKVMRPMDHERAAPQERLLTLIEQGIYTDTNATLERALADLRAHGPRFRAGGAARARGRAAGAGGRAFPCRCAQGLQQGACRHGGRGAFLNHLPQDKRLVSGSRLWLGFGP